MEIKLKAEKKDLKEKLSSDFLTAVVYGPSFKAESAKVKANEFKKVYGTAGESNLIKLNLNGKEMDVLVKEVQKHPFKDFFVHVDFYAVDMKKTLTTEIPFNFIGEAPAVKEKGGVLLKNMEELQVECLPGDLVDHFDIDLSSLVELGKGIKIKDLDIPKSIKVLDDENNSIAIVLEPKEDKNSKKEDDTASSEPASEVEKEPEAKK